MKPALLVVDDDLLILSMMNDILQDDYAVLTMNSPSRALQTNPEKLCGLVTDWNMEELSGLELIRGLRARRPDLPVIVVSGNISKPDSLPRQFPIAGGWENIKVVPKPFELYTLLQTIRELTSSPT